MSRFFGESVRKARREHFCDWCCNWIQPGEMYRREVWIPRKDSFHVMKEHYEPGCPPNFAELEALEMMKEERVALGEPIAFQVRLKEIILFLKDGTPITEIESEIVSIAASPALFLPVYKDEDDDVPF